LKNENRNGVATASAAAATKQLERDSTAIELIETSFDLLRHGEKKGLFELVTPERRVETGYVLIRANVNDLRSVLDQRGIHVMWGSEFGLSDQYVRLETLEPRSIAIFVETVNGADRGTIFGLTSKMASH